MWFLVWPGWMSDRVQVPIHSLCPFWWVHAVELWGESVALCILWGSSPGLRSFEGLCFFSVGAIFWFADILLSSGLNPFFGYFDAPWFERSWTELSSKETLDSFGSVRIKSWVFLKKRTLSSLFNNATGDNTSGQYDGFQYSYVWAPEARREQVAWRNMTVTQHRDRSF